MAVDTLEFIVTLLTFVSILIVWYWSNKQFKLMREQMEINIFADYTKRYQDIIMRFPENINEKTFSYEKLSDEERTNVLRTMRTYFDLCSEEFFLHQKKNLDKTVWKEWKKGMCYAFKKKAFREAWNKISKDTGYYDEFEKFVNQYMWKGGSK
ncbi:MAG: hypothetical protein FP824_04205 [Euryarchaeota archaeon]|nr:hypothetical protein [Euryarchaeota archaeon]